MYEFRFMMDKSIFSSEYEYARFVNLVDTGILTVENLKWAFDYRILGFWNNMFSVLDLEKYGNDSVIYKNIFESFLNKQGKVEKQFFHILMQNGFLYPAGIGYTIEKGKIEISQEEKDQMKRFQYLTSEKPY